MKLMHEKIALKFQFSHFSFLIQDTDHNFPIKIANCIKIDFKFSIIQLKPDSN